MGKLFKIVNARAVMQLVITEGFYTSLPGNIYDESDYNPVLIEQMKNAGYYEAVDEVAEGQTISHPQIIKQNQQEDLNRDG